MGASFYGHKLSAAKSMKDGAFAAANRAATCNANVHGRSLPIAGGGECFFLGCCGALM